MSLIQRIVTRRQEDIINQGFRAAFTGSVGTVSDQAIWTAVAERTVVVTGITLSTTSATDVIVSLGFKTGLSATNVFYTGYIKSGSPLVFPYTFGDEKYSLPGDAFVITTNAAGPTIYTINARIIGEKVALGYIQIEGAGHSGAPGFPVFSSGFSGFDRGGWPA